MAKIKKLDQCRTGVDFIRYGQKQGCTFTNGKGSHVKGTHPDVDGAMTFTRNRKQLGKGLARILTKWFVAAGLGVLIFFLLSGAL